MGRLQKKKTANQKSKHKLKVKQKGDESLVVPGKTGTAVKKSVFGAVNAKDAKIKLVQPSKSVAGSSVSVMSRMSEGDGKIAKGMQFLREVKIELNKVTWPTRQQTMASTVVVIILVIIISFFLGLVDMGLSKIIEVLLH